MTRAPNVLVFFTDQQRWDTAGCYGNPMGLTPRLDAMAAQGTRCEVSCTVQPVCGPARSCFQSGKYATETGCWHNGIPLPLEIPTLARQFGAAGYWTGYIGKWHLATVRHEGQVYGHETPVPPERRGGYRDLWRAADVPEFSSLPDRYRVFDEAGRDVTRPGYRVDAQTDLVLESLDTLAARRDRPFFLFVSYLEPHHQNHLDEYVGPPGWAEALAPGLWVPPDLAALGGSSARHLPGYYACVKSLDANLGRILDRLRDRGMEGETIVLFTSDHGNHFKTRNKEYKRSCHDASIRVPTVFQGPGFNGGRVIREPVSLLDWPATLLDAAGVAPVPGQRGRSLKALIEGGAAEWPGEVFVQISESQVGRAVRAARWTYGVTAPERDGWKDAASDAYVDQYLYDLERDPYQLHNLIGRDGIADVRDRFAAVLVRRMREAGEIEPTISRA